MKQPEQPEPVTYRNTKTGRVTRLGAASPLMDRSTRWVRVIGDTSPVEPGAGEETREGPSPAPFQPADHTVADVNAHLSDADPAERERVLQAEAEGKGRRGVLQGPYADLSGA